jgi:hypothetical protein
MLAFDIETTGLDPAKDSVTVVCTQDLKTGERVAYQFARVRATEPENEHLLKKDLVKAFDSASSLCAFNGVRFDIPFLYTALKLEEQTCAGWLLKTSDILEAARLGIFGAAHTFGLNLLCQHNHVPVKCGNGLQAIKFAQQHRWDELLEYCADDVHILCDLYKRRMLNNPRFHNVIDLSKIAHLATYEQENNRDLQAQLLAQLQAQNTDLQKRLAVYNEFCVCFEAV